VDVIVGKEEKLVEGRGMGWYQRAAKSDHPIAVADAVKALRRLAH
jgi:hypothetical protein